MVFTIEYNKLNGSISSVLSLVKITSQSTNTNSPDESAPVDHVDKTISTKTLPQMIAFPLMYDFKS
jgi:hypothetical protein